MVEITNAPPPGRRSWRDGRLSGLRLEPRAILALGILASLGILWRTLVSEGGPATIAYALIVTALLGTLILFATRRPLVAIIGTVATVVLISACSAVKVRYINLNLHAYDLVFYLPSGTTLSFLWDSYRGLALALLACLALTGVLLWLAARLDPIRVQRWRSGVAVALLVPSVWLAAQATGERRHTQFEYEGMYLTNFYLSWSETIETLMRGQLIEAAAAANGAPLKVAEPCAPLAKPPHIILIHHESAVQPSLFKQLSYDKRLDSFFQSDDGSTRKLRVETYGGASHLTEFSVITGLSTHAFGGMRQFIQKMMVGKIKETLPQALAHCGYRNVMFYPMLKGFMSADRFYAGAGLPQIFDAKAQGAKRPDERDQFYYANALDEMKRHFEANTGKPLFTFIETMATHWPYDKPFEPHMDVPGGGPGTHPEMHEFLRRLAISQIDYEWLRVELARRFPGEQFLILRYGDHHPMATRVLLGYQDGTEAEDVLLGPDSIGFQTFYAINGINFSPRDATTSPVLDVPYLGTVLMQAAGLPLPDSFARRRKLEQVCAGRYATCAQRELVLRFHRQLLDAGLLTAR